MDDELIRTRLEERLWRIIHICESGCVQSIKDMTKEIETAVSILFRINPERYYVVTDLLNSAIDLLQRTAITTNRFMDDYLCETYPSTGMKGRPKLKIPEDYLEFYVDAGFSQKDMSLLLGVSRSTIVRRLAELGISCSCKYANLSTDELDVRVRSIVNNFPNAGYRSVCSHLAAASLIVQKKRVMESMRRVDIEGVLHRRMTLTPVHRRQYNVRAPLSLWHIDGYHKLISWRIVVHGGIDGYSRMPVFLKASNNNRAETVLIAFQEAVCAFGSPERVRSDKGGENVRVAEWMLANKGPGSFIAGRSVHNQRIERLWRDLWDGCISLFYTLFCWMEGEGILNPSCEQDLVALHYVYLKRIQVHLDKFQEAYMRKPLRTANSRTPMQLWISGQALDPKVNLDLSDIMEFGIDNGDMLPGIPDIESVELEPLDDVTAFLKDKVDPLDASDRHGVDLFMAARDILRNASV